MSSRTTTALTIAGLTVCGVIAYALYFDHKRRTDVEFRKRIRKEKKRVDKSLAESREALAAANEVSEAELQEALKLIKSEARPISQSERETYFMSQVAMGEQLATRGDAFYVPAALSFYRALVVYPSPPELLAIYQKTVPADVVQLILRLVNLDVSSSSAQDMGIDDDASPTRTGPPSETSSQEWDKTADKIGAYYEVFPPKSCNVALQTRPPNSETFGPEKVLVLTKDVAAGEVIYKEHPMLASLDYDRQLAGTHCTHCLKEIDPSHESFTLSSSGGSKFVFCSKPCQVAAKSQWFSLLFTLDPPLPAVLELSQLTPSASALEARQAAQSQLLAYLNKDKRVNTLLMTKFIARQLTAANGKAPGEAVGDYTQADSGEYQIEDHIERWSANPIEPPEEEYALVAGLLKATLPGLDAFISVKSHKDLLGRIAFNTFGVCFGEGRDDRPPSTLRPEDAENTRTPYGTLRQIGTALYSVSSYLPHSCAPNARPSFASGTSELHLIANEDLKKGQVLSIAYVDVSQGPEEGESECRQRRRKELARGWKFPCECSRCLGEASQK